MLSKNNRLAKNRDIKRILALGKNISNPLMTIKHASNRLEEPRFTIVISTKVLKRATKRNRLKRLLREFIRLHLNKFRIEDYIIILKPKTAQIEEKTLLQSFHQLLLESKLL